MSSLVFCVPPLIVLAKLLADRAERRFVACAVGVFAIGVGSALYHATLLFKFQVGRGMCNRERNRRHTTVDCRR